MDPEGLTSIVPGTGHHKIPWEIITDSLYDFSDEVKAVWNSDAARIFGSWYNFHGNSTKGGISHVPEYNTLVRQELSEFFQKYCGGSAANMDKELARRFVKHIDSLPASHRIAIFNAAIRVERDMAAAVGKGFYDELRKLHPEKSAAEITELVLRKMRSEFASGNSIAKLTGAMKLLSEKGFVSAKMMRRFAVLGVLAAFFYGQEVSADDLRDAVVSCTPVIGNGMIAVEGYGALFEWAQEEVKKQEGYDFGDNRPKADPETGRPARPSRPGEQADWEEDLINRGTRLPQKGPHSGGGGRRGR